MAEEMLGFNGEIIRWAGEYYNMQADEAATAGGVHLHHYTNWKHEQKSPACAKLKRAMRFSESRVPGFFFPELPILPPMKGDLRTLLSERA